ncbi:hypothetical protein FRC09_019852, partial [Ceratobasidium sp. 395]
MKYFISTALVYALAVSATPSLVLDVAGPESVVDVLGLNVKVTLKNTGSDTLKLLNDPRSVLSKARTNTFAISSAAGSPAFTGIKVKYVPSKAAALNKEGTFTVLTPGQSLDITHSLAGVYDFTQIGEGSYNFGAANVFQYLDDSGELQTIEANTDTHQFKIAGKLAAGNNYVSALSKRAVSYTKCNKAQKPKIAAAAKASNQYVSKVNAYFASHPSGTTRYKTWFGAFDANRHKTVVNHFKNIGNDATSTNYDCDACKHEPGIDYEGTYAYVQAGSPGKIYLCGAFWKAPLTGTDSRAGTIVHENSHFTVNGGTDDHVYGQTAAKALA